MPNPMQLERFRRVPVAHWAVLLAVLVVPIQVRSPLYANGATYTFEEGRAIADSEMVKRGYNLSEWKLHPDPTNSEWAKISEIRRNSPIAAAREYSKKQESNLEGKTFWSFHYEYKTTPGVVTKDGVIWIFVSADTGEILLVIPPGH